MISIMSISLLTAHPRGRGYEILFDTPFRLGLR